MNNLAFRPSYGVLLPDDEEETQESSQALPQERPALRFLAGVAAFAATLTFVLGVLLASSRDPVFSSPILSAATIGEPTLGSGADFSDGALAGVWSLSSFHRLIAVLTAVLALICGAWTVAVDERRWMRALGLLACGLVVFQVSSRVSVVWFGIEPEMFLAIVHPLNAQILVSVLGLFSYAHSKEISRHVRTVRRSYASPLFLASLFLVGLVGLQLISGAYMRASEASLAVPDFPTIGGSLFPWLSETRVESINQLRADSGLAPATFAEICVHLAHRLGAMLVLVCGVLLSLQILRDPTLKRAKARRSAVAILITLGLEMLVGAVLLWTLLDPAALAFHSIVSAVLLASSLILSLRLRLQV